MGQVQLEKYKSVVTRIDQRFVIIRLNELSSCLGPSIYLPKQYLHQMDLHVIVIDVEGSRGNGIFWVVQVFIVGTAGIGQSFHYFQN